MPIATQPPSAPDTATAHNSITLNVLVALPAHTPLAAAPLHYLCSSPLPAGTLVRVPLGKRQVLGIVWDATPASSNTAPETSNLKHIAEILSDLPALDTTWRQLISFTARYYQRSMGEVALAALPPQLRELDAKQLARRLKTLAKNHATPRSDPSSNPSNAATAPLAPAKPTLTAEQQLAVNAACTPAKNQQPPAPILLFGSTGSGKTEVYLRAVEQLLQQDTAAQALVMVPEINLTPQLEQRFASRFPHLHLATLHSGMTAAQRLQNWLAAHTGQARIVLGTRMAVLASIPHLRLIIVDEEHDPSYKQQEGARYSARDLAIYRAHQNHAQALLGSATPSLESWHHSRAPSPDDAGGRYIRLEMPQRIGNAAPATVRLIDMTQQPRSTVLSPHLLQAIAARAARGEQSLLLLNRRGYAPILHCKECGWKSECPHCSAYRVFHKSDRSLRCHHCAHTERVPRTCPNCGNQDLLTLGIGTEQLEETLAQQLQQIHRPDGQALNITRIDADTTRRTGSLVEQLTRVHSGETDVLVGTQMVAKGHDFRRVTLVAALNPDVALFSSDFRAPERLFSLLMQAGGRAGRDAALETRSELFIQTHFPTHPRFTALQQHNYPAFAQQQLQERQAAAMPPFSFQALIRAESREQQTAQDFLNTTNQSAQYLPTAAYVTCYPAVPMSPQRIANRERAQMLIESCNRAALQQFLHGCSAILHQQNKRNILRWMIDVDPQEI